MNLIWICSDTFRNDYLGCMGNEKVKTPCLDALAADGVLFEEAYMEGFPTGPARLVYMTGKYNIPFRGWVPLSDDDVTLIAFPDPCAPSFRPVPRNHSRL